MGHGTRIARGFGRAGWTTLRLLGLSACDGRHPESEPLPDVDRSLAVMLDSAFSEVRGVPGAVTSTAGTAALDPLVRQALGFTLSRYRP